MNRYLSTCGILLATLFTACLVSSCKKENKTVPVPVVDSLKIGLLAYYSFNGNCSDITQNGNSGTAYDATFQSDRFGTKTALALVGNVTSYVTIPDVQPLRLTGTDFSLSAWINLSAPLVAPFGAVLSKRIKNNNTGWFFGIQANGGNKLTYSSGDGNGKTATGNTIIQGNWHMVTCVYTLSTQTLSLYVDGTLDNTTTGIPPPNDSSNSPLYVGIDVISAGVTDNFYNGALDDIFIYNRKLSASGVKALFITN